MNTKQIIALFFVLFLTVGQNYAQNVSTYAGGNGSGYSGDGGLAINAQINNPYGIVVDDFGHVYFADQTNGCIRKIDAQTKYISTVVSFDNLGNAIIPIALTIENNIIYFIDSKSGWKLMRFNTNQNFATEIVSLNGSHLGICIKNGVIYTTNTANHIIEKIHLTSVGGNGQVTLVAGTNGTVGSSDGPITSSTFNSPVDIVINANGDLIVADFINSKIRKIDLNLLEVSTLLSSLSTPEGLSILSDGTILIASNGASKIFKLSAQGILNVFAGTGLQGLVNGDTLMSQFNTPTKLTVDAFDNVYISDNQNNAIRKIGCTAAQPPSISTNTGSEEYCLNENTTLKIQINTDSDLAENDHWVFRKETCDGPILYTGIDYEFNPTQNQIIAVRAEGGCEQPGQCQIIEIKVKDCKDDEVVELEVFNSFTPNNDGVNDRFVIDKLPENSTVFIFNKWGDLVKKIGNYDNFVNSWKGQNNLGQKVSPGTYFYTIENDNNDIAKGWVQLIR